ncbi:unnamed protein product [Brachionus calyciflorus]|uniref:t-SNARE coiled-coil homology domain-containing protein n=1 Tax=Brachionus calyciflorus TaxID=104777 RepID=A0A813MDB3_9BILA|nr:unnamed protein product [Brachionus calyciflorus]
MNQDNLKLCQEKISLIEKDSLDKTKQALRIINETKEIGVKTAEELVHQGEQLGLVNERLDEVENTLISTQKNITQLKSFFGGIKNKFLVCFGVNKSKKLAKDEENESDNVELKVENICEKSKETKSDFFEITGSPIEREINKNLLEISNDLNRIKMLGLDMQTEACRQNRLIDNIYLKSIRTDAKIKDQNNQVKEILK